MAYNLHCMCGLLQENFERIAEDKYAIYTRSEEYPVAKHYKQHDSGCNPDSPRAVGVEAPEIATKRRTLLCPIFVICIFNISCSFVFWSIF